MSMLSEKRMLTLIIVVVEAVTSGPLTESFDGELYI